MKRLIPKKPKKNIQRLPTAPTKIMGRPTVYKREYVEQASKLAKLGATVTDLADFFGVDIRTIQRWMVEKQDFCRAVKLAREEADNKVKRSLYEKANGYSFEAEKIFLDSKSGRIVRAPYREHVPPSDTAMIFWLKNRCPEEFRDKHEVDHSGTIEKKITEIKRIIVSHAPDMEMIEGQVIENDEDETRH